MKKIRILILLLVAAATFWAFRGAGERYFDIARNLDIFGTLFKEVNAYYVDEVDPEKMIQRGISGMLGTLDPYTTYIPEEELEAFSIQTTGEYAGIGALIGVVNSKAVVTNPYPGFPAHRAGVRVGDEFVSINGKNVQGKSAQEISTLLKGKPQTSVEVMMKRAGLAEPLRFVFARERIKVKNVVYSGLIENGIGYIKIDDFTPGAGKEVEQIVLSLKQQGASSIVLDLRDNPGGLLHEAVNLANVFLPKGLEIVSTRGKVEEWNKTYKTLNQPADTAIPVVVLVGENSASASEIVAGALQDYDRGVLIGQRTFGKGLVQTTRVLPYNAQLKVTTARYYIPSGRCIQALDYAHRHADGTVDRMADSLKRAFRTKAGRTVYDGGGLDPDVIIPSEEFAAVTTELIQEGWIFQFASRYCSGNPAPPSFRTFRLTDADYAAFVSWIKTQPFAYSTALDTQAEKLLATAKKDRAYPELKEPLQQLLQKVKDKRQNDLTRFKPEITGLLEREIAFHYHLQAGQAEVAIERDPEIREARNLLSQPGAFKKLLAPR